MHVAIDSVRYGNVPLTRRILRSDQKPCHRACQSDPARLWFPRNLCSLTMIGLICAGRKYPGVPAERTNGIVRSLSENYWKLSRLHLDGDEFANPEAEEFSQCFARRRHSTNRGPGLLRKIGCYSSGC